MNWRKFVLLGCVVACVFAASTATAQMRGHGNSMSRMGMRGAFTPRSIARMPMHRAPMVGSMGRMPMHRAPMMNSALGLRRFNRFNGGDFDRDDRFHHFNHFKESSLSASSAFHGGGVLGGAGTGATTHMDPTGILSIRTPSTPATDIRTVTMAMVMSRPAMVTYIATRMGVTTAAITAALTTKMTMKMLCAMFSPNTQFLGTAMTRPPWVVSSLKTVTT
jgi:hypothetical protein